MPKKIVKGFTLIELLVVLAIIAILTIIGIFSYNKFIKSANCGGYKEQHRKVVSLAKETYGFCSLNGETYMNLLPGLTCNNNAIHNTRMTGEAVGTGELFTFTFESR